MKHVIVTRCKFDDEDKFENYFQVMKECYVKSINNQTNKNFSIALICNERHFQKIRDLVNNDIEIIRFEDQKKITKTTLQISITQSKQDTTVMI